VVNGIAPEFRPYLWPLLCGVDKARAVKGEHGSDSRGREREAGRGREGGREVSR